MVQAPTGNVVLEKLMLPAPAVAVTVPPQLLTTVGVVATTRLPGLTPTLVGRLSVKLASMGTTFWFWIVKVIVLTVVPAPAVVWIVAGLNFLAMEGGSRMTMPALAVPPLELPRPAAFAV